MPASDQSRDDLQAAVAARRELGRDYEDAVLDSFLDRMERSIAARVDARVDERLPGTKSGKSQPTGLGKDESNRAFVLGVVSLGTGIPISGIAAGVTGLGGLLVAWAGIVGVNVAHALAQRRNG